MIDILAGLAAIKKIDDAIGVIAKLVSKLKGDPDVAAAKLADALDEVGNTWRVIDEAISNYLKLGIDEGALKEGSDVLLKISGGGLLVSVQRGRGHCHIIRNIFNRYLDRWFQRVLNGQDLNDIQGVFHGLGDLDNDVFATMELIAEQLQKEANVILEKMIEGNVDGARQHVLSMRKDLQRFRFALSAAMAKLYDLRANFIEISGSA